MKDLRDLSPAEMETLVEEEGHREFRADQILKWLYNSGVVNPRDMTNLPPELRQELERRFEFHVPPVVERLKSADQTEKLALQLRDGEVVETVLIPDGSRVTVCVSTQVGCRMACRFCRTGSMDFQRNLAPSEITVQLLAAREEAGKITNVVFMGMGEPLDNIKAVRAALELLTDERAFGMAPRKITVSTIGLVKGIEELMEMDKPVGLALSLHSAVPETRRKLMPAAKEDLEILRETMKRYAERFGGRVTLEVALIGGVNDSPEHARALAKWAGDLSCKVNLIPFNPFPGSELEAPSRMSVESFQAELRKKSVDVLIRKSRGKDILAACGQLGKKADR